MSANAQSAYDGTPQAQALVDDDRVIHIYTDGSCKDTTVAPMRKAQPVLTAAQEAAVMANPIAWAYLIRYNGAVLDFGHGLVTGADIAAMQAASARFGPNRDAEVDWRRMANDLGEIAGLYKALTAPILKGREALPTVLITDSNLIADFATGRYKKSTRDATRLIAPLIQNYRQAPPRDWVVRENGQHGHHTEWNSRVDQLARLSSGAKKDPKDTQYDLSTMVAEPEAAPPIPS